jgi:hypothetical protein
VIRECEEAIEIISQVERIYYKAKGADAAGGFSKSFYQSRIHGVADEFLSWVKN